MSIWLLWYNDDGDYYVRVHDLLGVYETRSKADCAAKKEQDERGCGMDSDAIQHLEIEVHEVL